MQLEEAVSRFRAAAIAKADGVVGPEDAGLHKDLQESFLSLRGQGAAGRQAMHTLLSDQNPHVRGWIAAQLLSEGDLTALPVAKRDAHLPGLTGFSAAEVLRQHLAGELKSPFGLPSPEKEWSPAQLPRYFRRAKAGAYAAIGAVWTVLFAYCTYRVIAQRGDWMAVLLVGGLSVALGLATRRWYLQARTPPKA
jgi:hypothetical protein